MFFSWIFWFSSYEIKWTCFFRILSRYYCLFVRVSFELLISDIQVSTFFERDSHSEIHKYCFNQKFRDCASHYLSVIFDMLIYTTTRILFKLYSSKVMLRELKKYEILKYWKWFCCIRYSKLITVLRYKIKLAPIEFFYELRLASLAIFHYMWKFTI